jgi:hypothetical protein
MAGMKFARRIWKHFQDIIFWPPGLSSNLEEPLFAPSALPFGFTFSKIVA